MSFNFTIFASLSAGVSASCLTLLVIDVLEKVHIDKTSLSSDSGDVKRLPVLIKMFLPFFPTVSRLVANPVFDSSRQRSGELILMAGYDQTITPDQYVGARLMMTTVGILFIFPATLMGNFLIGVLVLLLLVAYPGVWLKNTVKRRHLEIQKALPTILDLLTLSIEAGKDFITALRDIVMGRRRDALSEELERTLHEIQLGKQRREALRDLARRAQQPDLTSVINAIIQADEMGVSIGQLLRIQGDQFRTKRFQRAEKLANEAPVKILFPVVVFIFPSVIVILMAPVIMQAFKTMLR